MYCQTYFSLMHSIEVAILITYLNHDGADVRQHNFLLTFRTCFHYNKDQWLLSTQPYISYSYFCTRHFLWLSIILKVSTFIEETFTWKNGFVQLVGHSFHQAKIRQRHVQYASTSVNTSDIMDSNGQR